MRSSTNAEVSAAVGFPVREATVERLARAGNLRVSLTGRLDSSHAEAFAASLSSDETERLRASEAVGMADLPDGYRAACLATLHTDGPAACLSTLETFVATGAKTLAAEERTRKAEASRLAAEIVAETAAAVANGERVERERTEARGPRLRMTVDGFRAARRITAEQADAVCETLVTSGVTAAEAALDEALDGKE